VRLGLVSDLFLSNTLSPPALPENDGIDHKRGLRPARLTNSGWRKRDVVELDKQIEAGLHPCVIDETQLRLAG
jgi:hypothetical protein